MAFQVFLVTVAVEAFHTDEEPLAWATAIVSVVLAAASVAASCATSDHDRAVAAPTPALADRRRSSPATSRS